jgi:carboxymethylenebutenolidase
MTTRRHTIKPGFEAHVALPASGSGPGLVLLQEIFGVNDYVEDAARRLAELGYVVIAPDLYWRIEPGLRLGAGEMERAFAAAQKLVHNTAVHDAIAALAALRDLPEVVEGRAGVLGFCLGGTLAWQVASNGDPDTAVCYYGSGISGFLEDADEIACPVLLHFGGDDPYIPRAGIDAVAAMAAGHDAIECHIQEGAGHAFDNSFAPQFTNPPAAAAAWELTSAFLARTLPVD